MENEDKLSAEVIWKMFAETDRLRKESDKRFDERFVETEMLRKESDKRFDKRMKELSKQIGGVGNGNGAVAENFFYHSFDKKMEVNSIKYDYLYKNLNKKVDKLQGEYDIVLVNSKDLLVVEVKYQLKSEHVKDFYEKQIPRFKKLFPEYESYKIYAAVAGLSVDEHAKEEAIKKGMLLFTQAGQELKKLSPQDMKPTVF